MKTLQAKAATFSLLVTYYLVATADIEKSLTQKNYYASSFLALLVNCFVVVVVVVVSACRDLSK